MCLSVFDHFVGLALKGLKKVISFHLISLTLFSVGLTNSDSKITNFLIHILICCLNLSKEFRFLYRFRTVFHIILSLKHSASLPCRELMSQTFFFFFNFLSLFFSSCRKTD